MDYRMMLEQVRKRHAAVVARIAVLELLEASEKSGKLRHRHPCRGTSIPPQPLKVEQPLSARRGSAAIDSLA
jgi:hypothetical protein